MESAIIPKPPDHPPDEKDILWQVHEFQFPQAANLYEAVDFLVEKLNDLIENQQLSEEEAWIFQPLNEHPPSISVLAYNNDEEIPTCLIYNLAYSNEVFSAGQNIVVIPIGRTAQFIYHHYSVAKLNSPHIPPLPEIFIQAYLKENKENQGFHLDGIFRNSWDASKQHQASQAIRGFNTQAYDQIYFLHNYSREYAQQKALEILKEHGLSTDQLPQLLDYNREE